MIDLHMHTMYSDGSDTVIELLKKCEDLKLKYISITDHDNCRAYSELEKINVSDYYTGKIIPGIEIKCSFKDGKLIEVLGYNIDTKKMQEWSDYYYADKSREKLQQKYFDIYYDTCIKNGIVVDKKENIEFNPKVNWASVTIFREMQKHKENYSILPEDLMSDFDIFSKKYTSDKNNIFFIDKSKDYPTVYEAVKIIKECGGLVFLPHVYIYKWITDIDSHIKYCINEFGIDGVECFHSAFTDKNIEYLMNYCMENNLLISGGSDYHGVNKPDISISVGKGNLKIDKKYVINWIE